MPEIGTVFMTQAAHVFDSARILVVGDLILDRYWSGHTGRISPEAPVPVVHVADCEERPGGAGNVALNISSLGASVSLLGVTGEDAAADSLRRMLEGKGVDCRFRQRADISTITKLRVLSQHQQLIRLDFEDHFSQLPDETFLSAFREALAEVNVVVLSDYAKGCLAGIEVLIREARAAACRVLVDPKGEDFGRYQGASIITPNYREFEAVVGPCGDDGEIASKGRKLCRTLDLEALLVTRGEQGMNLIHAGGGVDHLPARAREVYDVTGAGDTVIGVLAAALSVGNGLLQATALANLAASLVVGKLGAASVDVVELNTALHEQQGGQYGLLPEAELVPMVRAAHLRGERVVMTNGCFDILHAGHVRYLRQARELGDRLIVAVNDDASVTRLKGDGRPINRLAQRMEVLEALACVDWVVPFTEDTPARLIGAVLPDVLVKGGDYDPDSIAGGEAVRAAGGRVVVLGYHADHSTSAIIAAAHASHEREQQQT